MYGLVKGFAVPHIDDPPGTHGPGLGTAFSANDDPGDSLEVYVSYGAEQGFDREEARGDGSLLKMPDPGRRRVVFNGHAAPDMSRDRTRLIAALDIPFHDRTSLCQYLENMPVRRFHRVEHVVDECCGNSLVE